MKIITDNLTHIEPLTLRFFFDKSTSSKVRQGFATFAIDWFTSQEQVDPEKWRLCEYRYQLESADEPEVVTVYCELMPEGEVEQLAKAVRLQFPQIKELRLGEPFIKNKSLDIEWIELPAREVVINKQRYLVSEFSISFSAITLGQFQKFMNNTEHQPRPDSFTRTGYTVETQLERYGDNPQVPLFGLTYDDAIAYCKWSGYRLPTDPELRSFFDHTAELSELHHEWSGINWTSTPAGTEQFVGRDGPYSPLPIDAEDSCTKPLHKDQYELMDAPVFRVIRH
ncbi:Formylglycine-generating sulfatase enzyme [Polystyrenella longa]|uniref:Formylglycine-generating sulfatase enzyme n=1 Tax=Polystyrenella longa TaxID=2528007 RepID=A0A518CJI4_9PLAN|nr:SUMF1/EgtB/PvdO family nonheme iron enzyme [Polystyrenella longa]QDU79383.1 Formylglycine-generating sulfatase enzyme [Polystyrenella longa]